MTRSAIRESATGRFWAGLDRSGTDRWTPLCEARLFEFMTTAAVTGLLEVDLPPERWTVQLVDVQIAERLGSVA